VPTSAETNSQQSDARHADGPEGGHWLWWKNKRHDVPQGTIYRLLAYMWKRDSASYDALYAPPGYPVYDDPVVNQTIRSDASALNKVLKSSGVSWRLSCNSTTRHITKQAWPTGQRIRPRGSRRKNP
jgi:hypothetical protein